MDRVRRASLAWLPPCALRVSVMALGTLLLAVTLTPLVPWATQRLAKWTDRGDGDVLIPVISSSVAAGGTLRARRSARQRSSCLPRVRHICRRNVPVYTRPAPDVIKQSGSWERRWQGVLDGFRGTRQDCLLQDSGLDMSPQQP